MTDTFDIEVGGFPGTPGAKGPPGSPGEGYATRALMAARLAPALLDDVYLTETGREGKFVVDLASNWTAQIAADAAQAVFVPSTADATKVYRRVYDTLQARWFDAKGTGAINDTTAFQRIAALINAVGGGVIELTPGAIYAVGRQTLVNDGSWMFKPDSICNIGACTKPVIVRGNGAKMIFAAGLKYGTFNSSGVRTDHAGFYEGGELCGPTLGLEGMLTIHDCTAHVHVENLELDGNFANFNIGGPWGGGDGYQAPGDCLMMVNNTGGESTFNVEPHHAPRDSLVTWRSNTNENPGSEHVFFNGHHSNRQSVSIVGGRGFTFRQSRLNHTGKAPPVAGLNTAPGAGVDLESQVAPIRDVLFEQCEIADNAGPGAVSDAGDTADVLFRKCRIIGTTNYPVWLSQPRFKFEDCLIVGQGIGAVNFSTTDAVKFIDCELTNDPAATEYGLAYHDGVLNFSGGSGFGHNALFERCKVHVVLNGFPDAGSIDCSQAIIRDCTFDGPANTFLTVHDSFFEGRNVITMPTMIVLNMPGSSFGGEVTLNGTILMRGSATYDPPSLAAGASTSTTVSAPGAVLGDYATASFSLDTQGIVLSAYVSGTDTVTVRFLNETAGVLDLASGTLSVRVKPKGSF